jgi:type IV secretory pathway TrbD component
MNKKNILKTMLLLSITFTSFLFYIKGQFVLTGIGFIIAGILSMVFERLGAGILLMGGILSMCIASGSRLLVLIWAFLLFIVATYDLVQFLKIMKNKSADSDKEKLLELFHEKELFSVLSRKIKKC